MITEEINKKLKEWSDNTPSDVGVGYGFKQTNGIYTGEVCIVFSVKEKKPLTNLSDNEILPSEIKIALKGVEDCFNEKITSNHIKLEKSQEGVDYYPDNGRIDPNAKKSLLKLLSAFALKYPEVKKLIDASIPKRV